MESAAGYLPGRNLDQYDSGLLQCAFVHVHAVGGLVDLPYPLCVSLTDWDYSVVFRQLK